LYLLKFRDDFGDGFLVEVHLIFLLFLPRRHHAGRTGESVAVISVISGDKITESPLETPDFIG
jgi:hypothetical protein